MTKPKIMKWNVDPDISKRLEWFYERMTLGCDVAGMLKDDVPVISLSEFRRVFKRYFKKKEASG